MFYITKRKNILHYAFVDSKVTSFVNIKTMW
jgi:hypothetical protein